MSRQTKFFSLMYAAWQPHETASAHFRDSPCAFHPYNSKSLFCVFIHNSDCSACSHSTREAGLHVQMFATRRVPTGSGSRPEQRRPDGESLARSNLGGDDVASLSTPTNPENMILVMGVTGSGKSFFINKLKQNSVVEGHDLRSRMNPGALEFASAESRSNVNSRNQNVRSCTNQYWDNGCNRC